eukprot:171560-Prymnesium_polylepis.2
MHIVSIRIGHANCDSICQEPSQREHDFDPLISAGCAPTPCSTARRRSTTLRSALRRAPPFWGRSSGRAWRTRAAPRRRHGVPCARFR